MAGEPPPHPPPHPPPLNLLLFDACVVQDAPLQQAGHAQHGKIYIFSAGA